MAKINPNNIMTSLRGGRKLDEAIHITSFMDCHAHIRSLAMTPEGRLLCLGFTPSLNYVNLLWINTNYPNFGLTKLIRNWNNNVNNQARSGSSPDC